MAVKTAKSRPFADVTETSDPARVDAAILTALTEYDRRQSRLKYYNIYALPQYLGGWQSARAKWEAGASLRTALVQSFNGRLLDAVLKAVNMPTSTDQEQRM